MRRTEDIVYSVTGQTLLLRVPQGRPSAATFKVFADTMGDDGTEEFSGAATVDTVNTTINVVSGPAQTDPRKVNLASTAGIIAGRKYRISEGQLVEWVEVVSLGAGFVRVRDRLLNDYSTAAVFESTYVSATVDPTWVADLSNLSDLGDPNPDYRVRWSITVGGQGYLLYSYFDLVRAPYLQAVDLQDLATRFPSIIEILDAAERLDQARALIESACRIARADLAGSGINDSSILEDERLDELVTLAALMVLAQGGRHPSQFSAGEYAALRTERYETFLGRHFLAGRTPPRTTSSDSIAERTTALGLFIR